MILNMAKKMICKSAPEIELCMEDGGASTLLRFDVQCLAELQEAAGGIMKLFKMPFPEQAAMVVYAAAKNHNENYTLEDARKMVCCMDIDSVKEILNTFSESAGTNSEVPDEYTKKVLAQMLK